MKEHLAMKKLILFVVIIIFVVFLLPFQLLLKKQSMPLNREMLVLSIV